MSKRKNKKIPTATNSEDDDKNCIKNQNEDQIQSDGNRGKKIDSKNKGVKRPSNEGNISSYSPKECSAALCKLQAGLSKTIEELEDEHFNRLKLDVVLRDSNFNHKNCPTCIHGKLKHPQVSAILSSDDPSFESFLNDHDTELIELTTNMLDELDIAMKMDPELLSNLSPSPTNELPQAHEQSESKNTSAISCTRIEDGKLFFENEWYRSGQHIFIEGEFLVKFSGVICGISKNYIWMLKNSDNSKFRFHIDHLIYGEIFIARRIIKFLH